MRILLLGGTKFIGPWVARRLLARGHTVAVYHRGATEGDLPAEVAHIHCVSPEAPEGPVAHRASGEWLHRLPAHTEQLRAFGPEVVVHMRALGAADVHAAQQALRSLAQRLVLISSQDVYRAYGRLLGTEPGPPDPVPLHEGSPLRERLNPLAGKLDGAEEYDKIPAERAALEDAAMPGTVLRLPAVYGPGDYQHRFAAYLRRMEDGRPAILLDARLAEWRWTRGYVENVADAIALATEDARAAGRVYNVGEAEALPEAEWVHALAREVGWRGTVVRLPPERVPPHLALDIAVEQQWISDSSRIRGELGYTEQVPREEALRRTIAWERAHPAPQNEDRAAHYAAEDAALAQA